MMRRTVLIVLLIGGLLSACGSGDAPADQESTTPSLAEDDAQPSSLGQVIGSADQEDEPETPVDTQETRLAALEAAWAENRANVVAEIIDNGWGVGSGNVLTGPQGMSIDLDRCPSSWSDSSGVTEETIVVAHTMALSAEFADYGDFGRGMEIYFDYVNSNGGINGAMIDLRLVDDEYVVSKTIEAVEDLLDEEEPPFFISTLGSANSLAVYDKLNRACVPQPFVMSGHPAWGDPEKHPWTIGAQLSYGTEATMWGRWLKDQFPGELPLRVAALAIDNDFGMTYEQAFEDWAKANRDVVSEFTVVRHDPESVEVAEEMAELAEAKPDVFLSMTAGHACLEAIAETGKLGLNESLLARFTPSVCKDPASYVAPAGVSADGLMVVGGGLKSSTDPQYGEEPFVVLINQLIADAGEDQANGLIGTGAAFFGWNHVEALRIAAELPGGLTRSNLILAFWALDLEHPMLLDGIGFKTEGAYDPYPVEGSEYARFDAGSAAWVLDGRVGDVGGSTRPCSWGRKGCS